LSSRIVIAVEQEDPSTRRTFALDGRRLRRFGWAGVALLVGLVGAVAVGGWHAHDLWGNGPSARAENAVLRTRLQSLQAQQTRVDQSLSRVMAYDSKIRQMTREDVGAHVLGLGPLSELEIAAAEREGGGVVLPGEELELSGIVGAADVAPMDDIATQLDALESRAADLEGRVLAEEESLQEVRAYLDDRTSLLRATPSVWPVRGWVTSHFGWRKSPHGDGARLHSGMDIAAPIGTPIISPADGHVVFAGYHTAYGNLVVIDHGYGLTTKYAHTSRMLVGVGERVQRGDLIARVGNTGRSTGPHLHFEVIKDGVSTSPMRYLRSVPR
jgi:murein DD-endopeptidase MepM/ murein hydrolase activator NlpD